MDLRIIGFKLFTSRNPHVISLFILVLLTHYSSCIDIKCNFKAENYATVRNCYSCIPTHNLHIFSPNTTIQAISGNLGPGKTIDSVTGLKFEKIQLEYFPSNLGETFKNLVAIRIKEGRLKEIHQSDFKLMKKLQYLNLDDNDIKYLEDDLFKFNPQLEIIFFNKNKISAIRYSVFEGLKKLADLDLDKNECIKEQGRGRTRAELQRVLRTARQQCSKEEIEKEAKVLKQKCEEERRSNTELTISKKEIIVQNSAMEKEIKSLQNTISNISNILTQKQNELILARDGNKQVQLIDELKVNSSRLEIEIEELNSKLNLKIGDLSTTLDSLDHFKVKNSELKEEISGLKAEVTNLNEKLVQVNGRLNSSIENAEKYKLEIENVKNNSTETSLSLTKTITELSNTVNLRNQELENSRVKITQMEQIIKEKDENFTEMFTLNSKTIMKLHNAQETNKNLQTEINQKSDKIKEMIGVNIQTIKQLEDSKAEARQLEAVLKIAINNLDTTIKKLNKTSDELNESQIKNFNLARVIEEAKINTIEMEVKFNETLTGMSEKHSEEIEGLEQKLSISEETNHELVMNISQLELNLNVQIQANGKLTNELESAIRKISVYRQEIFHLNNSLMETLEINRKLSSSLIAKTSEFDDLYKKNLRTAEINSILIAENQLLKKEIAEEIKNRVLTGSSFLLVYVLIPILCFLAIADICVSCKGK